ncbi:hypothetical protein PATSB16_11780 [Pandoraea thiooxydans]|uniref:DUF465 domain-containing protein n=1 Tax=Pandoraea thiooxydans TaxID=445709 RepID=A0A0G3EKC6_9BURK|nr:DUF465 domain-containing protein [Pandoraea thiooxydans]AKJ67473.1 hypothetical protein ABW99_03740 [Pandoraea thiooxydans]APR94520.1 hypothetical protein PATSB16_11780 [Pandoraea thiooxydans]
MQDNLHSIGRRIIELQIEHRDLDYLVDKLMEEDNYDELQLRRLKKRRLKIKDAITLLQLQQAPDTPA